MPLLAFVKFRLPLLQKSKYKLHMLKNEIQVITHFQGSRKNARKLHVSYQSMLLLAHASVMRSYINNYRPFAKFSTYTID